MGLLNIKKRKTIALYIIIGILYAVLTIYSYIVLANIYIPFFGKRKIWIVFAFVCIIIVSYFEKKKSQQKFIWIFLTGTLITFLTSYIAGVFCLYLHHKDKKIPRTQGDGSLVLTKISKG